jgi:hypothetical protein
MTDKKLECFNSIDKFFELYKDNDYMLQRIYSHIVLNMPNTLETESKNYEKRINLNSYLTEEQQIFMQVFLSKNNYYYLPNNNLYYEYNGSATVKFANGTAWGRVDSIIYLCDQQFKTKPIATLETKYATSFLDGKVLSIEKFDVNEANLEGSLRQLSYFEKEFYSNACK